MKTFREHLSEEIKIGALASGGIGIERDAVRDEINGILSGISSMPCITPYSSLNRIRKALAYFSIFLPKRVYMEGRHGIEVWEIHQFGDKMGMTDQGEFIKSVPAKYYLFFHYHLVGSMYYLESKIVDDKELEERLNRAESMVAEGTDAACQQTMSKAVSPKEPMHDVNDKGSASTKKAVDTSEKGLKEEEQIDELSNYTLSNYMLSASDKLRDLDKKGKDKDWHKVNKREHGMHRAANKIITREKKLRKALGEEQMEEGRMPASVIAHKQKLANMTPDELKKKFAGKSEEHLKSMARRHGYGKDSDVYSKHVTVKEDNLDEVSLGKLVRYKNKAGEGREKGVALADKKMKGKAKVNASMPKHPYMEETDAADETNMAKSQLKAIGVKSSNLASMMKNPKNLPAWVQSKLSVAKDGITSVDDYMTHSDKKLDESAKKKEKFQKISKAFKEVPGQSRGERDSQIMSSMGKQKETVHRGEIRRALKKHLYGDKNKKVDQDVKNAKEMAKEKMYWPKGRPVKEDTISEKAPPGAKYERMVKHIKAGYAKDGLTKKEKGIAFATAWKAKNKEKSD